MPANYVAFRKNEPLAPKDYIAPVGSKRMRSFEEKGVPGNIAVYEAFPLERRFDGAKPDAFLVEHVCGSGRVSPVIVASSWQEIQYFLENNEKMESDPENSPVSLAVKQLFMAEHLRPRHNVPIVQYSIFMNGELLTPGGREPFFDSMGTLGNYCRSFRLDKGFDVMAVLNPDWEIDESLVNKYIIEHQSRDGSRGLLKICAGIDCVERFKAEYPLLDLLVRKIVPVDAIMNEAGEEISRD